MHHFDVTKPTISRPHIHFTPPQGWINDPNGLVYFNGEWHLFYQYYEPSEVDGMQWGHAVSRDLFHWEHLAPALQPDSLGHIWSGSAVVDHHDTSGLFGGRPGIVCLFTYWTPEDGRQSQGLAFSADGRTFAKHDGNPVIPQLRHLPGYGDDPDFRDPKVFWHEPSQRWIMAVAGGKLRIFSSRNLIEWQFESIAEDISTECPDLIELAVDGNPGKKRWVLLGGGRWYILGKFDGKRFVAETETIPMTHCPDFYATQTWSDAPDGRCVAISWLFKWAYDCGPRPGGRIENKFPTNPWSGGCLSVPCELKLVSTPDGDRLTQAPVPELEKLRLPLDIGFQPGEQKREATWSLPGAALDIALSLSRSSGVLDVRIPVYGGRLFVLSIEPAANRMCFDRTAAVDEEIRGFAERYEILLSLCPDESCLSVRVVVDGGSIEVFAEDGLLQFSAILVRDPARGIEVVARGGGCVLTQLSAYTLRL